MGNNRYIVTTSRMSLTSSSLLVPLTFLPQNSSSPYARSCVETSYCRSQIWVMKSWGVLDQVEGGPPAIGGMVIGSKDGTLYVFNQSCPAATAVDPHRPESQLSRPTSPFPRESRATSQASTPLASSPAPFNITSRARSVSGVTTEQVEAPKNYVDFEDEPEKLKDMLNGRNPRESKETPNGSAVDLKLSPPSLLEVHNASFKRSSVIKPTISTTELPSTANSISSSTRDRALFVHDLRLWCHILPPRSGPGSTVTSISLLDHNESVAVLQEMGLVQTKYRRIFVNR